MAGWIAAGASLVGDLMSQSGQQSTNAENMAMVQQQEAYQTQSQAQAENYDTQMSDTAMQRRVTDLDAAGLNPLLAISEGGASAPVVSGQSGSTTTLQNPNSAFGQLGSQITGAENANQQQNLIDAQTKNVQAQTEKTISETPDVDKVSYDSSTGAEEVSHDFHASGNATLQNIQAQTGATGAQAQQILANVQLIQAQTRNQDQNTALQNVQALLQDQNFDILKATKQALIQQQLAAGAGAANQQSVESGTYGKIIAYINSALHPISNAAGAAAHFTP